MSTETQNEQRGVRLQYLAKLSNTDFQCILVYQSRLARESPWLCEYLVNLIGAELRRRENNADADAEPIEPTVAKLDTFAPSAAELGDAMRMSWVLCEAERACGGSEELLEFLNKLHLVLISIARQRLMRQK